MNILLVDDHFSSREGVAFLLEHLFPDIHVFHAENCEQAMETARNNPLHLVLLDIDLPGRNGLEALIALKSEFESLCVVMFSGIEERELVFEALKHGAMGFIPKKASRQDFVRALKDVVSGRPYLPAFAVDAGAFPPSRGSLQIHAAVPAPIGACAKPDDLGLTPREYDVLRWVVQGMSNKEIARRMGIEEQTVKNHMRPIFGKFGVSKRAELIVKVFKWGIALGAPGVGNHP
jgi:DNA-binding NarL/FixJ family response regulator